MDAPTRILPQFRAAAALLLLLAVATGVAYPLLVTGAAALCFPAQAGGSIVRDADGRAAGSALIGQDFAAGDPARAARWFWGRPSATAPSPDTPLDLAAGTGSAGSNLAPSNPALAAAVRARIEALRAADAAVGLDRAASGAPTAIPVDLVTASASGLDPHLSPAGILYQLPRVARARGMKEEALRAIVDRHTHERTLGLLGERTVDVLGLNRALDAATRPRPHPTYD
ncbi:MAG: potassium-transporting ATPase subunit KdpC [Phycisphaerales bacterium]